MKMFPQTTVVSLVFLIIGFAFGSKWMKPNPIQVSERNGMESLDAFRIYISNSIGNNITYKSLPVDIMPYFKVENVQVLEDTPTDFQTSNIIHVIRLTTSPLLNSSCYLVVENPIRSAEDYVESMQSDGLLLRAAYFNSYLNKNNITIE